MKPLLDKERLDGRIHRASSVTGWNFPSGISVPANSPYRFPRHVVPQIFAYEPKPGVFKNLNYPAFHSIRIEQVCIYISIGKAIFHTRVVSQKIYLKFAIFINIDTKFRWTRANYQFCTNNFELY